MTLMHREGSMLRCQVALLLTASLLSGCGQVAVFGHTVGEKPPPSAVEATAPAVKAEAASANTAVVASPVVQPVRAVSLVLTPQATAKVKGNAHFQTEALLAAIETELRSRKLLVDGDASVRGTAEIAIDDFAVRPTSNAVVLGYIINDGTLAGELRVRVAGDGEAQPHRIAASSRLTVAANGSTAEPLGPLYRRFANVTADWLAGTPSASEPSPVNDQRHR